jgi:hypothetical protein
MRKEEKRWVDSDIIKVSHSAIYAEIFRVR